MSFYRLRSAILNVFTGRQAIPNPIKNPLTSRLIPPPNYARKLTSQSFFLKTHALFGKKSINTYSDFLKCDHSLHKALKALGIDTPDDYIYAEFVTWLTRYAAQNASHLQAYFTGRVNLQWICNHFITFCFRENIALDKDKTLHSFKNHNEISDAAIKNELMKLKPKNSINLLGFGLDDGDYEKSLAKYIIQSGLAREVKLFGYDPFAKIVGGIEFLKPEHLTTPSTLTFDIITARWVLHHIHPSQRWHDLTLCINRCNSDSLVLIVEHGFLKEKHPEIDVKLYTFLNAIFDVIANIGIRPLWFTATRPHIGSNFFIKYLKLNDFKNIQNSTRSFTTQRIIEVGPPFPNQTLCTLQLRGPK